MTDSSPLRDPGEARERLFQRIEYAPDHEMLRDTIDRVLSETLDALAVLLDPASLLERWVAAGRLSHDYYDGINYWTDFVAPENPDA